MLAHPSVRPSVRPQKAIFLISKRIAIRVHSMWTQFGENVQGKRWPFSRKKRETRPAFSRQRERARGEGGGRRRRRERKREKREETYSRKNAWWWIADVSICFKIFIFAASWLGRGRGGNDLSKRFIASPPPPPPYCRSIARMLRIALTMHGEQGLCGRGGGGRRWVGVNRTPLLLEGGGGEGEEIR